MKMIFCLLLIMLLCGCAWGQGIVISGPTRGGMLEGQTYDITWSSDGIKTVSITAFGTRTPLGDKSRGDFSIDIASDIPTEERAYSWTVPWIDSIRFNIRISGYDSNGVLVAEDTVSYGFRPAVLARKMADGIYLDLHQRENQRLYVQRGRQLVKTYLSTSSNAYFWLPKNTHISKPHDHAGIFRVLGKELNHRSMLFDVDMPYAMRYTSGHFIHATHLDQYDYLGTPASSGCNRLTLEDARELYNMTPIGTRVEIIGP